MASSEQNINVLQPLQGELPAGGSDCLTLFLCCHRAEVADFFIPHLLQINDLQLATVVHLHVLEWTEQDRAHLTLLNEVLSHVDLSATGEQVPDTYKATTLTLDLEFGLIRLHEIHRRVPRCYMFCSYGLHSLPDQTTVETRLTNVDLITWANSAAHIAVGTSKAAYGFLAAVSQALAVRLKDGTLAPGNGHQALATVRYEMVKRGALSVHHRSSEDTLVNTDVLSLSSSIDDPLTRLADRLWILKEGRGRRVLMPQPDMSLPFKTPGLVAHRSQRADGSPLLQGSMGALRHSWQNCFNHIREALGRRGHTALAITIPGSDITSALANASDADVVIMPHRQHFQCRDLEIPALYLMQIAHRWLFTVDTKGWGAGADAYPYDGFDDTFVDDTVFNQYQRWISENNDSKFDQPDRRSRDDLIADGTLPEGNYVFFPCQIPDDEVVRFFCDVSEEDVISALASWADKTGVKILFKAHPFAPQTSETFKAIAQGENIQWVDASIHDLIEHCEAVYTLNSGVGHEGILHGKPVVMFGRSEYDQLAIRASVEDLDGAYNKVKNWHASDAIESYQHFYHWFTRHKAIDLRDDDHLDDALNRVVDMVEAL